jgi:hypothetical protein
MKAWHFVNKKLRDGSPIPRNGKKLVFKGTPIFCKQGLHASLEPFDALQYAPGNTLCLVECGGTVLHQSDKLVCTERTIIVRMNAEPLLRFFARQQALSVIHLYPNGTDDVVFDYLMAGDEKIRGAARAAARDAWYAALDARAAARAAAGAAGAAARAAAGAAGAAARAAALHAARAAAWRAAKKDFNELVYESFEGFL